ncbi:MAG: hypothetical protein ABSG41_08430 [Bryobacteraceae bacterium]|jgi:hypothetical protein
MKSKKKRPTKAVTLLTRIETLLSDVIDECSDIEKSVEKNVRELLTSAQASISSAIDFFSAAQPSEVRRKPAAKKKAKAPVKAKKRSITPAARKRAVKA